MVGFAGALLVIRPGEGLGDPAVLLILTSSFIYALYQIATRWVSRHDNAATGIISTIAGLGGMLLHYNGTSWATDPVSGKITQFPLWNLWGSSGQDLWAFGDGGVLLHNVGGTWSTDPMSRVLNSGDMRAVWGNSRQNIWPVGEAGAILNANYDSPIRTYTDLRMETSCERPACPNQVMSLFRTWPGTQIVEHETLMAIMTNPGAQSATYGCRRTCKPPMGYRSMRKLPRSSNTLRSIV